MRDLEVAEKKLIPIIYEDDVLIIINKRSGLLSVPASSNAGKDLCLLINQQMKTRKITPKIFPCHRLDKETSGVIVFAKGKKNQEAIMNQFRKKSVKKTYIAFVQGHLKQKKGILRTYIQGTWPYRRHKKSKLAITSFELICNSRNFSVVKVRPATGRTNQIRIQFRDFGNPLVGERRFAFAKDWQIKFGRVALHSLSIDIIHPITGARIKFSAPLPKDMNTLLKSHGIFEQFKQKSNL